MVTCPVAFYMRPVNCSQRKLWLKWASVKVTPVCLLLSGLWICASVLLWFSWEVLGMDCLTCCLKTGGWAFWMFCIIPILKHKENNSGWERTVWGDINFFIGKKGLFYMCSCYCPQFLRLVSSLKIGTCSWTLTLLFLSKEVAGNKASVVGLIPSPKPVSLLEPKGIYLCTWWFASFHSHGF